MNTTIKSKKISRHCKFFTEFSPDFFNPLISVCNDRRMKALDSVQIISQSREKILQKLNNASQPRESVRTVLMTPRLDQFSTNSTETRSSQKTTFIKLHKISNQRLKKRVSQQNIIKNTSKENIQLLNLRKDVWNRKQRLKESNKLIELYCGSTNEIEEKTKAKKTTIPSIVMHPSHREKHVNIGKSFIPISKDKSLIKNC